MDIILVHSSGEPIYQQIINQIKVLILTGKMEEGEMLPSIRQLAKDLRISVITTKRAYEDLEREGYIRSIPGKGSFVAPHDRERMEIKQRKLVEEKATDFIKESKLLNLSLEEMIGILQYLDEEND